MGPQLPRAVELELIERLFQQHRDRSTSLAAAATTVPVSQYVSAEHLRRETTELFQSRPVFACMSADIANPGDRLTLESGGIPIVVVRTVDGDARAYVNVCRHRGAPVVRADGPGERSFVCPFHGWVYDTSDGRLLANLDRVDGFEGVDTADLGLASLPIEERHGMVIVRPKGSGPIDADDWLCGLGDELAGLGYDGLRRYKSAGTTWRCNWKLLIDTFLESYHVPTLHKASIAASYIGAASPFDAFGPHNRIVVPQAKILEQENLPRDQWNLMAASVLQYFLAPNLVISNMYGYVMTWRFIPHAVDRTTVEQTLYTYRPASTSEDHGHFDERFEAARAVTGNEDFPESELVHASLASGAIESTVVGRNEPGIAHFHDMIRDATEG